MPPEANAAATADQNEECVCMDVEPIHVGPDARSRFAALINEGDWVLAENGFDSAYSTPQRIRDVHDDKGPGHLLGMRAEREYVCLIDHELGFVFDCGAGSRVERIEAWMLHQGHHERDVVFVNHAAALKNRADSGGEPVSLTLMRLLNGSRWEVTHFGHKHPDVIAQEIRGAGLTNGHVELVGSIKNVLLPNPGLALCLEPDDGNPVDEIEVWIPSENAEKPSELDLLMVLSRKET